MLYRTLGLIRRMGGSEDLDFLVGQLQKAIRLANQLRLALLALEAARMAAGDPIAWAMAGVAVAEFSVSIASEFEMRSPTY